MEACYDGTNEHTAEVCAMVAILASSPTMELCPESPAPALYEKNGFLDLLREVWPESGRCLMIAADPDIHPENDEMTNYFHRAFLNANLSCSCFELWDNRRSPLTREQLHSYDVILLAGGHVPTEHRWFERIHLKELIIGFSGIVIGISAGSMNAARTVYGWPERKGESSDPNHSLFFPGLGLADTIVLPHYQKIKGSSLDGRALFEDITCSHSFGRRFYAIPDGSYVLVENGVETLYGEADLITQGSIYPFCSYGQTKIL